MPGYTLSSASGTVSINGASQVVTVAFTPITTPIPRPSYTEDPEFPLFPVLMVVVVGGIVAALGTMLYTGTGPFKKFKDCVVVKVVMEVAIAT